MCKGKPTKFGDREGFSTSTHSFSIAFLRGEGMNIYKLITHDEIEKVVKNIRGKIDFEVERKYKGYEFRFHSSRAGVDFENGTKEGDYILGMDFSTSDRGWGIPISGEQLRELEDVNKLRKYIDEQLAKSRIEGYETIEEGQISLFEIMI